MNTTEDKSGPYRMGAKEGIVLCSLLGIVLLVPLLLSHFSLRLWNELSWRNPVDVSMIEWGTAFLNTFLFLLLLEVYRQDGRKTMIFLGAGFLSMGLLGFEYALSVPGSETAAWLKGLSLLIGSLYFLLGVGVGEDNKKDLPSAFTWIILPSVVLTAVCGWFPYGLSQILPHMMSPSGTVTIFGDVFFCLAGAMFFVAAIPWLRGYVGKRRNEDLVFAVVTILFAQISVAVRSSQNWGVLWWGWHIGLFITGLLACTYLLILCLRYSLVWRLLFSLGFVFVLTVLVSSGIIQSYFEKRANEDLRDRIMLQQRIMLSESSENLAFCSENLKHLSRDLLFSEEHAATLGDAALKLCSANRRDWSRYLLETGFCSDDGIFISSVQQGRRDPAREKALLNMCRQTLKNSGRPGFSEFYFDDRHGRWVVAATLQFRTFDGPRCFFFNLVDVSKLRGKAIPAVDGKSLENAAGRVIMNGKTGKIIYCGLPQSYVENAEGKTPQRDLPLTRKLASLLPEAGGDGKIVNISDSGRDYLVVIGSLKTADWVVFDIIDDASIPYADLNRSRYIFEVTGTLVFLVGFIILSFLLDFQLARPLGRLIRATSRLEAGDFTVRINSKETNELGIVSNSFDRMVSKLREYYDELQRTVAERTKALQEAKEANSVKTHFFTNISHELRTPLHGIMSFARLGMDRGRIKDAEKAADYFTFINDSAERLLKMINSLLSYAKLESGRMEFNFSKTSLLMIVLQAYTELRPNFEDRKMRFECPKPDFDTTAWIDGEKILTVVKNLFGNALKFSEPGGLISVSFERGNGFVTVKVSDQGPGIPENELDSIFDRFFQADKTKAKGGTGLGLSICMEIIKLHNGTIHACNNDDAGASFVFSVPIEPSGNEGRNENRK